MRPKKRRKPELHGLTFQQLAAIHPFHFVLDGQMRVVQEGNSLKRILPGATGQPFERLFFRSAPPLSLDPLAVMQPAGGAFTLTTASGIELRGRFLADSDAPLLYFFGAPLRQYWAQLGLSEIDFPLGYP